MTSRVFASFISFNALQSCPTLLSTGCFQDGAGLRISSSKCAGRNIPAVSTC